MHEFKSSYGLGEEVHLDGDSAIKMRIIAIAFRMPNTPQYEVSWWDDRDMRTEWVWGWRLSPAR